MNNSVQLEHSDMILTNVHDVNACAGRACAIHRRSDHSMRNFPQVFRFDNGFMERICSHDIGHPDPDDPFAPGIHGCDGCCNP